MTGSKPSLTGKAISKFVTGLSSFLFLCRLKFAVSAESSFRLSLSCLCRACGVESKGLTATTSTSSASATFAPMEAKLKSLWRHSSTSTFLPNWVQLTFKCVWILDTFRESSVKYTRFNHPFIVFFSLLKLNCCWFLTLKSTNLHWMKCGGGRGWIYSELNKLFPMKRCVGQVVFTW